MHKPFQQELDEALSGVERHVHAGDPSFGKVHFEPISEYEHRNKILKVLSEQPSKIDSKLRVHVGVAGAFNFSIACQTRPEKILLLDINPNQEIFWKEVVQALKESPTAGEFREKMKRVEDSQPIRDDSQITFDRKPERRSGRVYQSDWIRDPDKYAYLHQMASAGNIAAATVDIVNDRGICTALGGFFKKQGLHAETCYWSNIASYFHPHLKGHSLSKRRYVSTTRDAGEVAEKSEASDSANPVPIGRTLIEYPDLSFAEAVYNIPDSGSIPMFERMMQNISLIGFHPQTMHMLTDAFNDAPLILYEGPPRNIRRGDWVSQLETMPNHGGNDYKLSR